MTSLKTSGSGLSPYCQQKVLLVEGDRLVTSETFSMLYIGCCEPALHGELCPEKYGSWKTVYSRFRRWQKRGYLTAILKLLTLQADMNHIMIDGTYVHAHKHSAGARHTSGINQALGRSRGGFTSKIHAVVDALGNLLAFTVTAGQYSEYPQASNLLIQYHNTTILADKGYDSRSLIDALHQQGCEAVIPSRRTNHHPRTIDRHLYKERHLIETFFNKIKEYRKIATRYDKLAEVFAAFACLAASLIWLR